MTREIRPGHVAFFKTDFGPTKASRIRRAQKRAGNRHICVFCGEPQLNYDAVVIHQKICEYRDEAKRRELRRRRARKEKWNRMVDRVYDLGYQMAVWLRGAVSLSSANTRPVRGPEVTYPNRTQRLLDSNMKKYGSPRYESGWKTKDH